MDTLAQLQVVDQATLTPLVRQALGSDSALLLDWQVAPFGGGAFQCVYRFTGRAQDRRKTVPWSLIVKVTTATTSADNPSAARYWKREMLAYQSGLLADLPAGLTAPRCFGVTEQPGGGWLWLEEITDAADGRWLPERFHTVARRLGVFGGAYVTGLPVPVYPWLSRGWFRSHVASGASSVAELPSLLDHPHLHPAVSAATAARILQLRDDRETLFDALDRLPQTFCHLDINPRNLFVRNAGSDASQLVAIDWEFAGVAALGAELASLIGGSLLFNEADLDTADDLEAAVFASYLKGLADTGWRGDPREVRLGYTIALALHLVFVLVGGLVGGTRDAAFRMWAEKLLGQPYATILERSRVLLDFYLARADEARQLLRSV